MKLLILIVALMFTSCKVHKLTDSDIELQPYLKGDVLIFKSSKGEIETLEIVEIYKGELKDPLALFPKVFQSLTVMSDKGSMLKLKSHKSGDSYIEFTLDFGENELRYPGIVERSSQFKSTNVDKENHIIIAKEFYDNLKSIPFDLDSIVWSQKLGYLKLEFKNDYWWKLQSFNRRGENIFISE